MLDDDFAIQTDPELVDDIVYQLMNSPELANLLQGFLLGLVDANTLYEQLYEISWLTERQLKRINEHE